jgi:hypothetical protein
LIFFVLKNKMKRALSPSSPASTASTTSDFGTPNKRIQDIDLKTPYILKNHVVGMNGTQRTVIDSHTKAQRRGHIPGMNGTPRTVIDAHTIRMKRWRDRSKLSKRLFGKTRQTLMNEKKSPDAGDRFETVAFTTPMKTIHQHNKFSRFRRFLCKLGLKSCTATGNDFPGA